MVAALCVVAVGAGFATGRLTDDEATAQTELTAPSPGAEATPTTTAGSSLPSISASASASGSLSPSPGASGASASASAGKRATATPKASAGTVPSVAAVPAPPVEGSTATLVAVGDIACDPDASNFNGGKGTTSNCHQMATSNVALALRPDAVLPLGDVQYEQGTAEGFSRSYHPSWGRLKSISRPVVGNHEYLTDNAAGYYGYFGAVAGDPSQGYYSYDLGSWHMVALNSNCSRAGGCSAKQPQGKWLIADLAAHKNQCTLAYWHHPRWSHGEHGDHETMSSFMETLYAAGAEVVLVGHDHDYERFAPLAPDGSVDREKGIRQFVVGSGGRNHYVTSTGPTTEAMNDDTYGVLHMTLKPNGYDWKFVPEVGKTYSDSGSGTCH